MAEQNTTPATPSSDFNPKVKKVHESAGTTDGRLEQLNVRPEHIASEQLKEKLIAEGKILEAERSRYTT